MTEQRWKQVKAIFDRAVECNSDAREEVIRESCGTDRELLTEVLSLVASDVEAKSLLENPLVQAGAMAALAPTRDARPADPMVGRTIGNYIVTSELAHGGMGIVYSARHVSLPREVVVKCIRPIACSADEAEDLRARFRREAYIQAQLDHPHIVRVYEFFDGAEEYFLVMEYVHGLSLRSMLDQRTILPAEEACALAAQALDGLACAHTLRFVDEAGNTGIGIIHRDIKPANMLLDERGQLKLTDFGIAKILGNDQLTKTGFSPGTAEYMSPEQIRGLPADARSDLYSLGVTLYEMLAGRVPFSRTSAGSDYGVLKAHIETEPTPIRTLNAGILPSLADVVARSLKKDPNQRWQTAAEFREALGALQGNRAITVSEGPSSPDGFPQRARHYLQTRRFTMLSLGALVLAGAATGFVWRGWGGGSFRSAQDQASIAVLPFADLSQGRDQEYFSDGLAEELLDELARTPGLRVAARTSSFRFGGKAEDTRVIGNKLHVATILEGSVRRQNDRAKITVRLVSAAYGSYLWSNTYEREMSDIFEVQASIANAVTEILKVKLLRKNGPGPSKKVTNTDAYNAYLQGQYFLARNNKEGLERAIGYFDQAIRMEPSYAPSWIGIAQAYTNQFLLGYGPSDEGYRNARKEIETALALDPGLGDAYDALGRIRMYHDWDWPGADAAFRRALELEPGNSSVISNNGKLARALGRSDEAAAFLRQAIRIDPLNDGAYHSAGVAFYYAGLRQEAVAAFRKALDLSQERPQTHSMLANVYLLEGQPQEALVEARQEKNPFLQLWSLALAYHALGRKNEADASLAELIAKGDPFVTAEVYAFRGETKRAFESLDEAYSGRDPGITFIKGDPLLKSLERDPRYAQLLRKMRLPI
jgi:serine/threonine-protein kinase